MDTVSRPVISGPYLYSLLIREFERLRPAGCKRCRIPLPYWGPAAGNSEGYWYMGTPADCPQNCRRVITELWAKVTAEHVISPPPRQQATVAMFVDHPEWAPD
jgi:hypothetical protein